MGARAIIFAGMLLWCCPQLVAGAYGTMPVVVTLEKNTAFEANQSQPEFNLVSSCMNPSWTLFESAHSNHSHRDGDECRCYDDRFIATSQTCMACFENVPGSCINTTAVTSADCSSVPDKLEFVAEVDISLLGFNEVKQEAYKSAVAKSLQVEAAAVMITEYYLAGSRRRLLAARKGLMVKTKVLVPPGKMPEVSVPALAATLQSEMRHVGIDMGGISDLGVKLEFRASLVGTAMEFFGIQSAWDSAVANSFQVELVAVSTIQIYNESTPDFSRRRLLAATPIVMVKTEVLVPPDRVPHVSGTALAAALQSKMQDVLPMVVTYSPLANVSLVRVLDQITRKELRDDAIHLQVPPLALQGRLVVFLGVRSKDLRLFAKRAEGEHPAR